MAYFHKSCSSFIFEFVFTAMKKIILIFIFVSIFLTGCAPKKSDYVVTIHTEYGNMIVILYDETPNHKENFLKLARDHFYDSLLFHRIMRGFMIQGGDPYSKNAPGYTMLGLGGPGYTVDQEINPKLIHERGALAAARLGDGANPSKASNGSQFYIIQGSVIPPDQVENIKLNLVAGEAAFKKYEENPEHKRSTDSLRQFSRDGDTQSYNALLAKLIPKIEMETGIKISKDYTPEMIKTYTTQGGSPNLDMEYTVFGKVVQGIEVVDSIAKQPTHLEDRPVKDIRMFVTVEEMSREDITGEYGYVYPSK
jgi:peptidyl-prolyl cis-trans isomerase B (cyclophilin B)